MTAVADAPGFYWLRLKLGGPWEVGEMVDVTEQRWDMCGTEWSLFGTEVGEVGPRLEPPQ